MTEELKPCPFCGGKEVKLFKEGSIWVVECLQCLAKVGATLEAEALDFWNYRPKEEQLCEQIREMKQKNNALKREILEEREDNVDIMEYYVAERERLRKLLKSCCNEFVKNSRFNPCDRVKTVDAKGRCTARATCPIYAELTKGAENDA